MTQVKEMTNEHLNIALSKLMGRTESTAAMVNYGLIKKYCEDPAASLEVQAAAIAKDAEKYVRTLAIIKWGDAVDPEEVADWPCINVQAVGDLLDAKPRERSEAAYMVLSQVRE